MGSQQVTLDVLELARQDTHLKKESHNEYSGPCPRCHGTDRFRVRLKLNAKGEEVWKWMCRGCHDATIHGWGDEIEYHIRFHGMTFTQAKKEVGDIDQTRQRVNTAIRRIDSWQPPTEYWQDRQHEDVMKAVASLWSEAGATCLAFLRDRGLKDDTIRGARLGFTITTHPRTHQSVPVVVIPWYVGNVLWRVQYRVILPDTPHPERYFQARGSSNGGLYLGESLKLQRQLVLMVEGEFDALILAQECGDIVAVVATGSTIGARSPHILARLAQCQCILVAYDSDEKGDEEASYWLKRLENATRYRPLAHDVNAMHLEGLPVRRWIEAAIKYVDVPEEANILEESPDKCIMCGAPVHDYTASGDPYCQAHWPKKSTSVQAPPIPAKPKPVSYYIPVTLPPLDRRVCPFVCVVERHSTGRTAELKPEICNAKATHNGWCEEHQRSHMLLELGALLNYRRVEVHECRTIAEGCGNWEAYAKCSTPRILAHDLPALKKLVDQGNKTT